MPCRRSLTHWEFFKLVFAQHQPFQRRQRRYGRRDLRWVCGPSNVCIMVEVCILVVQCCIACEQRWCKCSSNLDALGIASFADGTRI